MFTIHSVIIFRMSLFSKVNNDWVCTFELQVDAVSDQMGPRIAEEQRVKRETKNHFLSPGQTNHNRNVFTPLIADFFLF